MRLIEIFIRKPVVAIVLHLAILLIGARAIQQLPIVQYPIFESSSLIIKTHYVGASADTVRGFVTTPIERAVATTPGLDYMESSSKAGLSTVTAKLQLGQDGGQALTEVSNSIDKIRHELPAEAEPPHIEIQRGDRPWATFYLAFTSTSLDLPALSEYVTRDVLTSLAGIPGVQRIAPMGETPRAMRVWLDTLRMSAFNLDASDIAEALRRNNYVAAVGQAQSGEMTVNLQTDTNLTNVQSFRDLIVRQTPEGTVRLSDVARVEMGTEEQQVDARVDRQRAVYLEVWPLASVSELEVDAALKKRLQTLQKSLPPGVKVRVAYNATNYMRDSLVEVSKTLAETVLIVALVVFLFLGSLRTALVPLAAVPISLVGAAAMMSLMGMSLNLLTLLALVLCIGLVVDDAIVVVESVQRQIREGKSRTEAALASARLLAAPIVAMTLTLAVVFTPIGFLSGLSGVLLREFAFTLACAVLVSGVVALTLSPMMSAWASAPHGRESRLAAAINRLLEKATDLYRRALAAALRARAPILLVAVFLTLLIPVLFTYSGRELAPVEDQGEIDFVVAGGPSSTVDYMAQYTGAIVDGLLPIPGSDYVWLWTTPSRTVAGVMLDEWKDRDLSAQALLGASYAAVSRIPGVQAMPFLPPAVPSGGMFDVEFVVAGDATPEQMQAHARNLMATAMASGKFLYTDTDLKIDMPVARLVIDRAKVAELGLDLATVARTMGAMVGGDYVNRFDYRGRPYKVVPQVEQSERASSEQLLNLRIRTPSGETIPLSSVASIVREVEPRSLNRFQQTDSFRIRGGVTPGVTKDAALKVLEGAAAERLPANFRVDYAGESRQMRQQGSDLIVMGAIGVALIYLVLALQFGGFRDPLVVLLGSMPLALAGALMFTFFDVTTINLYSQIGLVTLTGLIAKNAILVVEFANRLRNEGRSRLEAAQEAAVARLRPVMMTTIATVAGHLPLVFVSGPGSAARNSIGLVLVAGMAIGTVFTLFVLPCVYSVLASRRAVETPGEPVAETA